MKFLRPLMVCLLLFGCKGKAFDFTMERTNINTALDNWHKAAGAANFNAYMGFLAPNAIYIGTDATERWTKDAFMLWAKPFFDAGKAWNFTAVERHISIDSSGNCAWFDELLKTQMKICRGSGFLTKYGNEWKLNEYVLSMTVPNDKIKEVVDLKGSQEDSIIRALTH